MYRVELTLNSDSSFKVKSKDYEFNVDTKGNGMTPPDVLLASVVSCLGVYIRKYLEGAKINTGAFAITAEADFSEAPPYRFQEIKVMIDLKNISLDEKRKQALLVFIKNCPVHNTLKANPEVNIQIQ